jgi:hypothetical protein
MTSMKTHILLLSGILLCLTATAQIRYEISIGGGGGLSAFNYKPISPATANMGFGGQFGAGYVLFLNNHWGIGTGAGISFFGASAEADGAKSIIPNLIDDYNDTYELRTTLAHYTEKQRAAFVRIPLFAQYIHKDSSSGFYAQAGVELYIPLSAKYSAADATLINSAYYPTHGGEEVPAPKFAGLGTFAGYNAKGNLKLKTAIAVALEAGWRWKLPRRFLLYTGAYLDYGINNIRKESQSFVIPNAAVPANFSTNSVLNIQNAQGNDFADRVSLLAAGITVRLVFGKAFGPKVPADTSMDDSAIAQADTKTRKAKVKRKTKEKEQAVAEEKPLDMTGPIRFEDPRKDVVVLNKADVSRIYASPQGEEQAHKKVPIS